jgi:predicted porin
MKTKLIIAAFAIAQTAMAGKAMAQSEGLQMKVGDASFKLYGVLDIGYGNLSGKLVSTNTASKVATPASQKFSGLLTGGLTASRLGVAGDMPFGDGYKGLFVLELGPTRLDQTFVDPSGSYRSSVTNGLEKTRKSYVGLSGGFGTVIAGRLQSPAYDWAFKYDALSGALDPIYQFALAAGAGINTADRINDAITYISPKLGGFTFKTAYAFANSSAGQSNLSLDDATAINHKQNVFIVAADYDQGPLSLGAVYRGLSNSDGLCANSSSAVVACATAGAASLKDGKKEWGVGGSYDFTVVKVLSAYQSVRPNASSLANKFGSLGLDVPVGAKGHAVAIYAFGKGRRAGATGTVATDAHALTVAYTHTLNKYLTTYVGVVRDENGGNLFGSGLQLSGRTASANVAAAAGTTLTAAPGQRQSGVIAGLRVTF